MYHRRKFQSHLLETVYMASCLLAACLPAVAAANADGAAVSMLSGESAKILPFSQVGDIKHCPARVELYEKDDEPLGSRRPLLMVHGVRGELWANQFRWKKLADYLSQNPEFEQQYKIYFARYNSYQPLDKTVAQFKPAVLSLSEAVEHKPITVVALSIGGNVVAQSMIDSKVDSCIKRVITLGTPFHGSPLFTSNWMDYSMCRWHKTPLTVLDTCLPYDIYFSKHKNLLTGLNWDNTDGLIPDVGRFRLWYKPLHARELSPGACGNPDVRKLNAQALASKSKFITYAGYLASGPARRNPPGALRRALQGPAWFVGTVLPEHAGREHPVLRSLNLQIAHAVVGKDALSKGKRLAYALNDGITPLTSSLYLSNEVMSAARILNEDDVPRLRSLVDVKRARVFKDIDHLTFIDEFRPRRQAVEVQDLLSDNQEAQPMFSWILNDILNDGQDAQLAVGPKRPK